MEDIERVVEAIASDLRFSKLVISLEEFRKISPAVQSDRLGRIVVDGKLGMEARIDTINVNSQNAEFVVRYARVDAAYDVWYRRFPRVEVVELCEIYPSPFTFSLRAVFVDGSYSSMVRAAHKEDIREWNYLPEIGHPVDVVAWMFSEAVYVR